MKPQFFAREVPVFGQKWEGFGPSFERAWFDAARALSDAPFGDEAQRIPCGSFEVSAVMAARQEKGVKDNFWKVIVIGYGSGSIDPVARIGSRIRDARK